MVEFLELFYIMYQNIYSFGFIIEQMYVINFSLLKI